MYNSLIISERIKSVAKSKNISIGKMLEKCELSKNALSSMVSGGSFPKVDNLAKIADYLGCSIDYLLGRTNQSENIASNTIDLTTHETEVIKAYRENKQLQEAIDRMLGIFDKQTVTMFRAAHSLDSHAPTIEKCSKTDMKKLENAPVVTSDEDL